MFEEEDFQPSVYGYNLATMFSDSKASSMLRECEDELQKSEKKLKNQRQQCQGQMNGETKESEGSGKELELINAVIVRLRFLRNFHTLLLHIWKRDNLNECSKLISICQESLVTMQKTSILGVQRNVEDAGISPILNIIR